MPMPMRATDSPHRRFILRAHVARANPVWQEAAANPDALVIFQGPAAYISPTWYPSKHDTHRQVPTYNYMVVHAHGRIVVRDDEAFVRGLVARLTRKMEAGEPVPWKMGDAPADFITQMLGAIVGIEIEVTRLVGKWKLGQNKAAADRRGAAETLLARASRRAAGCRAGDAGCAAGVLKRHDCFGGLVGARQRNPSLTFPSWEGRYWVHDAAQCRREPCLP